MIKKLKKKKTINLSSNKGIVSTEGFILLIGLLLFGIISIIGYNVFSDINTDIQADSDLSNTSKNISSNLYERYPSTIDGAFVTIIGLLYVVLLIAAYFSNTHPAIMIVIVILLLFVFIVAGLFSNIYSEFTGDSDLSDSNLSFPIMNYILNNLLLVGGAMFIGVLIVIGFRRQYS